MVVSAHMKVLWTRVMRKDTKTPGSSSLIDDKSAVILRFVNYLIGTIIVLDQTNLFFLAYPPVWKADQSRHLLQS